MISLIEAFLSKNFILKCEAPDIVPRFPTRMFDKHEKIKHNYQYIFQLVSKEKRKLLL